MADNRVSYPVATGSVIEKGFAVAVNSGELFIADDTELAIGVAFEGGTAGEFVGVVTAGEFYCPADGAITAGQRVCASDAGDGSVKDATGLFGRMLGVCAKDAVGGVVLVSVRPFDFDAP
jgi:hypothetical protein